MNSFRKAQTGVVVGLMAIMVNVGVVQGVAVAAASSPLDPVGVARAAADTDPHLPLSAQTLQREAEKFAAATTLMGQLRKAWAAQSSATQSPVAITPNSTLPGGGSGPTSASLAANQQAQQTTYWCGPAAVSEALGQRSYSLSQASAASQLKTTTDGTAWSGVYVSTSPATGYPVADVMNNRTASSFYVPIAVSYTATTADKTNYQPRLVTDVLGGWPIVGNAWEVAGYDHLVGHPFDQVIFHWFDIRGYANSGADTLYEDSVAGSSITWAAGVPAYSTIASDMVVSLMGGRGYIW